MKRPDLRYAAEGPPGADEEVLKDGPIDHDEKRAFDQMWISAHDARTHVSKAAGSRVEALALLREALVGGMMWTRGVPSGAEHRNKVQADFGLSVNDDCQRVPIHPSFWAAATKEDEAKWNWPAGEFSASLGDPSEPQKYFGVEFPIIDVDALCEDNGLTIGATATSEMSPPSLGNGKGGRPSGNHGEPIARLTLKLSAVDGTLDNYTGESLVPELVEEYVNAGLRVPGDANLLGFCRGILRVARAARQRE